MAGLQFQPVKGRPESFGQLDVVKPFWAEETARLPERRVNRDLGGPLRCRRLSGFVQVANSPSLNERWCQRFEFDGIDFFEPLLASSCAVIEFGVVSIQFKNVGHDFAKPANVFGDRAIGTWRGSFDCVDKFTDCPHTDLSWTRSGALRLKLGERSSPPVDLQLLEDLARA